MEITYIVRLAIICHNFSNGLILEIQYNELLLRSSLLAVYGVQFIKKFCSVFYVT